MIIVAPYTTDAPIYHWPIATGGIILMNTLLFFATTFQLMLGNVEEDAILWLLLEFDTINPLQWITGAFMHADFMHLIGNMFFLWSFGIVVEGKIGSLLFFVIYTAIAAVDGVAIQVPMFLMGSEGAALGASGVIFALMVIAMLWAPENELDCFYFVGFKFGTFEVRIFVLGAIFVCMQIVFLFFQGFGMSSEMLHMIGALIGLPVGLFMLRQGLVDCEGWDVISRNEWLYSMPLLCTAKQRERIHRRNNAEEEDAVTEALRDKQGNINASNPAALAAMRVSRPTTAATPTSGSAATRAKSASPVKSLLGVKVPQPAPVELPPALNHPEFNRLAYLLRQAVEAKSVNMAKNHYQKLMEFKLTHGIAQKTLGAYVTLLGENQQWIDSLHPLTLLAIGDSDQANQARLRMAQVQMKMVGDRDGAKRTLEAIRFPQGQLTDFRRGIAAKRDALLGQL